MSRKPQVTVIGAGISGLCVAHWIHRGGGRVTVLEQNPWPGGTMRTIRDGDWLIETGPNSALETTPLFGAIFDELGITAERLYANPEAENRYILRSGRLHALPLSPFAFIRSDLWTTKGKLRLLAEPFIGRGKGEESVAAFVERRLGREFLDYAINPFVAGVYAGDPEDLSIRAAFPKLYALEERYGGLVRGMIGGARERRHRAEKAKDRARMISFAGGMQSFPDAIAKELGPRIRLGMRVTGIARRSVGHGRQNGFVLRCLIGRRASLLRADAVVVATPAYAAARLLGTLARPLSAALSGVQYSPVAGVYLGFHASQIGRPLDGFGFLVPAVEQREILGTIWSSSLFPGRAPRDSVALTTFVGGSRQPGLASLGDRALVDLVTGELQSLMNVSGTPVYTRVAKWKKAIPQYRRGYAEVAREVQEAEADHPGLFFCSNFLGGIAVGDCLMNAKRVSERALLVDHGEDR